RGTSPAGSSSYVKTSWSPWAVTPVSVQPLVEEVGTPSSVSPKSGDEPFDQFVPCLPRRSTVVVLVDPMRHSRVMRPLVSVAVVVLTLAVVRACAESCTARTASRTHATPIRLMPGERAAGYA